MLETQQILVITKASDTSSGLGSMVSPLRPRLLPSGTAPLSTFLWTPALPFVGVPLANFLYQKWVLKISFCNHLLAGAGLGLT
jgi:hypothetical protein